MVLTIIGSTLRMGEKKFRNELNNNCNNYNNNGQSSDKSNTKHL